MIDMCVRAANASSQARKGSKGRRRRRNPMPRPTTATRYATLPSAASTRRSKTSVAREGLKELGVMEMHTARAGSGPCADASDPGLADGSWGAKVELETGSARIEQRTTSSSCTTCTARCTKRAHLHRGGRRPIVKGAVALVTPSRAGCRRWRPGASCGAVRTVLGP